MSLDIIVSEADFLPKQPKIAVFIVTVVYVAATIIILGHNCIFQVTTSRTSSQQRELAKKKFQEDADAYLPNFSKKAYELSKKEVLVTQPNFAKYDFKDDNALYRAEAEALKNEKSIIANVHPSIDVIEL